MPSPKKEFKVDTLRSFDKADLFKQKWLFSNSTPPPPKETGGSLTKKSSEEPSVFDIFMDGVEWLC
jgi:hypothetical protein